mmetsp:Transcript_41599/g.98624  ORF Transcript_41599/g.98624 Transcript_41599/m.98624 type:complete len:215 (+) Transcript_41599:523-1167(+)
MANSPSQQERSRNRSMGKLGMTLRDTAMQPDSPRCSRLVRLVIASRRVSDVSRRFPARCRLFSFGSLLRELRSDESESFPQPVRSRCSSSGHDGTRNVMNELRSSSDCSRAQRTVSLVTRQPVASSSRRQSWAITTSPCIRAFPRDASVIWRRVSSGMYMPMPFRICSGTMPPPSSRKRIFLMTLWHPSRKSSSIVGDALRLKDSTLGCLDSTN